MKRIIVCFAACMFVVINSIQAAYAYTSANEYTVFRKTYKRNGIVINFPKINGFIDEDEQKEINYLLERESFRIVNDFINQGRTYEYKQRPVLQTINEEALRMPDDYVLEFSYSMGIFNEGIISIIYCIVEYWPHMQHSYEYRHSFTIDIQNRKTLKLEDLFIDARSVINYKHETVIAEEYYIMNKPAQGSFLEASKITSSNKEETLIAYMSDNHYPWHINSDGEFVVAYFVARFIEEYKISMQEIKQFMNKDYYTALGL